MKTIHVSDATYRTIASLAILPFNSTGARQPDGSWIFPVDDEVYERIQKHRLAGESEDDTIQRMIRHNQGRGPN